MWVRALIAAFGVWLRSCDQTVNLKRSHCNSVQLQSTVPGTHSSEQSDSRVNRSVCQDGHGRTMSSISLMLYRLQYQALTWIKGWAWGRWAPWAQALWDSLPQNPNRHPEVCVCRCLCACVCACAYAWIRVCVCVTAAHTGTSSTHTPKPPIPGPRHNNPFLYIHLQIRKLKDVHSTCTHTHKQSHSCTLTHTNKAQALNINPPLCTHTLALMHTHTHK